MKNSLVALFFLVGMTINALADPTCKSSGSSTAAVIDLKGASEKTLTGLTVALAFGLDPPSFPAGGISETKNPCLRGTFVVGSKVYSLFGGDGAPVRWATAEPHPVQIVFLAELPRPEAALAAVMAAPHSTSAQFQNEQMMFVLALTAGNDRQIYRFYDAIPDDSKLEADIRAVLNGELPPVGTFNPTQNRGKYLGLAAP